MKFNVLLAVAAMALATPAMAQKGPNGGGDGSRAAGPSGGAPNASGMGGGRGSGIGGVSGGRSSAVMRAVAA